MAESLTIPAAARALAVSPATLYRWIRRGAPVARDGRQGPGCPTLVDLGALRAWRAGCDPSEGFVLTLASELHQVIAAGVYAAFREIESQHKAEIAGHLAASWWIVATHIADHLRGYNGAVPDPSALPRQISHLREICLNPATMKVEPEFHLFDDDEDHEQWT